MNRAAQAIGRKAGLPAQVDAYKQEYEGMNGGRQLLRTARMDGGGAPNTSVQASTSTPGTPGVQGPRELPPGLKKKKKLPPPWQSGTFNPQGVKAYQQGLRGTQGKPA